MPSRELLYEYGIDATAATYITCYIVAIQTFGFTVALFYRAKSIAFNLQNRSHTAIVYFLSFGLANLCSGITHQFYPHTQHYSGTPTGFYIFWISVLISQLSRLSCFMLICDLLSYETGNELLTDIYRALNALIFLLFVGPIVQCCCCKSLSGSPPKQFRVWMVISFVIWIPFVIMSFMILDFYYTAVLQSLIFIYFIPKSVMDLRANTNKSSGCQPDYWYIASSITAVIAIAIYSPFAAGCIHNENGYSDNPDDENYCPYPLYFNHNAVLHVLQVIGFTFMFLGVWMAREEISKTEEKVAHELEMKTAEVKVAGSSETMV